LDPSNAEAWNSKGNIFRELERLEEAAAAYDAAVKLNPGCFEAWCNKGKALMDLVLFDESFKAFDEATRINPNDSKAWHAKAWRYSCRENTGKL
jgi:tetratricopeptide (TPR) repeat protein